MQEWPPPCGDIGFGPSGVVLSVALSYDVLLGVIGGALLQNLAFLGPGERFTVLPATACSCRVMTQLSDSAAVRISGCVPACRA